MAIEMEVRAVCDVQTSEKCEYQSLTSDSVGSLKQTLRIMGWVERDGKLICPECREEANNG